MTPRTADLTESTILAAAGDSASIAVRDTVYTLTRMQTPGHSNLPGGGLWFTITGPRGATYGLIPHLTQPYAGEPLTLVMFSSGRRDPKWSQGLDWYAFPEQGALRVGYVR